MEYEKNTLGYHRAMSAAVFGEDSKATKFLDEKIAKSPEGANEIVIADESQIVRLLATLHLAGNSE